MIGTRIREIRTKQRISLSELAQRAGFAKSYLSSIERNLQINPSVEFVKKIAAALQINPEVLLGFEKDKEEEILSGNELFIHVKRYVVNMDDEQLKELADYINFTLWKRNNKC
jgi:XRE family transcriptional regulator of biofilm formation